MSRPRLIISHRHHRTFSSTESNSQRFYSFHSHNSPTRKSLHWLCRWSRWHEWTVFFPLPLLLDFQDLQKLFQNLQNMRFAPILWLLFVKIYISLQIFTDTTNGANKTNDSCSNQQPNVQFMINSCWTHVWGKRQIYMICREGRWRTQSGECIL